MLGTLAKSTHTLRCPISMPRSPAISLVASWWQARKHIANWWLWIVVDLIYIGEYIYKDLWLTALLYAGLVVLAVLGLRDWQRAPAATLRPPPAPHCAAAHRSCSGAAHRPPTRSARGANCGLDPPTCGVISRFGQLHSG